MATVFVDFPLSFLLYNVRAVDRTDRKPRRF